jgi:diguanylate cyclase (GGDEF)-like protein
MSRSLWEVLGPQVKAMLAPSVFAEGATSEQAATLAGLDRRSLEAIQRLTAGVCQATADAASEVSAHQVRMRTLADELGEIDLSHAGSVAAVVQKLLAANAQLQERLKRTEQAIESHQEALHSTLRAAQTDALTGLQNRRVLETCLKKALREHRRGRPPVTLLMFDLDHFKSLNDTHGHMAGDAALRHVAEILRRQAASARLVARYGGEEFAVLLACRAADAAAQAEALRLAICQTPFFVEGAPVPLTASGGLAEQRADDSPTGWIERADKALYAAKRHGRNCMFWIGEDGTPQLVCPASGSTGEEKHMHAAEKPSPRVAEADLAPDAFADATFPDQVARRIAEWKRGGPTLTVVLARVVAGGASPQPAAPSPVQMRSLTSTASRQTRAMDVLTRWQHDGLALLLPGMGRREASGWVGRWLRSLPMEHGDLAGCSLRIGIAEGLEGNDACRVLERAWLAVQASQEDAAGRVFVHDGVRARPLPIPLRSAASR